MERPVIVHSRPVIVSGLPVIDPSGVGGSPPIVRLVPKAPEDKAGDQLIQEFGQCWMGSVNEQLCFRDKEEHTKPIGKHSSEPE